MARLIHHPRHHLPRPRYLPRPRAAALLALLPVLLLTACAQVDRTVTARDFLPNEDGRVVRTVAWESNRYPPHSIAAEDDACWEAAAVGQPVPEVCLTSRILYGETDPYDQHPTIALAGTLAAIAALLWFTLRRVAWQPAVDSRTTEANARRAFSATDAVALMHSVDEEKLAQGEATEVRRDVRRPALVGALLAAAALLPLILLVGYGPTLGWANATGAITFFGVAFATVIFLIPLPPRPADPDSYTSRLLFLAGATAVLTVVAFLAVQLRVLMLELNGIAPLG